MKKITIIYYKYHLVLINTCLHKADQIVVLIALYHVFISTLRVKCFRGAIERFRMAAFALVVCFIVNLVLGIKIPWASSPVLSLLRFTRV